MWYTVLWCHRKALRKGTSRNRKGPPEVVPRPSHRGHLNPKSWMERWALFAAVCLEWDSGWYQCVGVRTHWLTNVICIFVCVCVCWQSVAGEFLLWISAAMRVHFATAISGRVCHAGCTFMAKHGKPLCLSTCFEEDLKVSFSELSQGATLQPHSDFVVTFLWLVLCNESGNVIQDSLDFKSKFPPEDQNILKDCIYQGQWVLFVHPGDSSIVSPSVEAEVPKSAGDHVVNSDQNQGAVSIRKTVLLGMAIPMLKIRRPNGRLIFNMEITIRR